MSRNLALCLVVTSSMLSVVASACCEVPQGCGELDLSGTWTEQVSADREASSLTIDNADATKTDVTVSWERHGLYDVEKNVLKLVLLPWDRLDAETLVTLGQYDSRPGGDNHLVGGVTQLWVQADRSYPCVPEPGERYCAIHHQLQLSGAPGEHVLTGELLLLREARDFPSDDMHITEVGRVPVSFSREQAIQEISACVCGGAASSTTDGGVDAGSI